MLFFRLKKEKELDNLFFDEIRTSRLLKIEKKRRDYLWGPPEYRLHPSEFKYTMCPVEYVQGKVKFNGISKLEGVYWANRGSSVHTEYQADLLRSPKLHPIVPRDRSGELSFFDPESGISGRLDGLFLLDGEAIPLEIKVKATEKSLKKRGTKLKEYIAKLQELDPEAETWPVETSGWEEFTPDKQHICQGAIYCWALTKLGMVKEPITKFILAYIHAMYDPIHSPEAEKQFVIQYDAELQEKTTILVDHLSAARQSYIAGGEMVCTYSMCWKHTRKKKG